MTDDGFTVYVLIDELEFLTYTVQVEDPDEAISAVTALFPHLKLLKPLWRYVPVSLISPPALT